jgi:hypothetical protein
MARLDDIAEDVFNLFPLSGNISFLVSPSAAVYRVQC